MIKMAEKKGKNATTKGSPASAHGDEGKKQAEKEITHKKEATAKKAETPKAKAPAKVEKKAAESPEGKVKAAKEEKKEVKTDTKKDGKGKDAKTEKKEEVKKPKRKKQKTRKVQVKKSKEIILQRNKVLGKTGLPTFRGRFGKRSVRKKSIAKWNKWRFPRGIDVSHEVSDGYNPREGYRTPRAIRDTHPSGFKEFYINTINELENVPKNHAIRVLRGIGKKKKLEIVDKAIEKGIKVLNP